MLTPISNRPIPNAWGSRTLIADLEGRAPSGDPEAEVWFGDHPGSPARVEDGSGRTLDAVTAAEGAPLPYLLKLLAAASTLSIQVHPSKTQAEEGFAREDAAGLDRNAGARNYRDENHKPELIVALSDRFEALAGLRDLAATQRLVAALGDSAGPRALAGHLGAGADALADTVAWVLSGAPEVADIIAAARSARSREFAGELAVARRLSDAYPGDPGVVVALLMNLVVLHRGEALFVRAGALHAYLSGLGVELMAASDNVLRGGLTPKHIDVDELRLILDATPGPAPVLAPAVIAEGVEAFAPAGIPDFLLLRVTMPTGASAPSAVARSGAEKGGAASPEDATARRVTITGPAIVLVTGGAVTVRASASGTTVDLTPGAAVFATADEGELVFTGSGEAFVAQPGVTAG
ncbi:mannose-6-phosphate isomerase, class I [Microbacterium sp. P02]|uniref:mannose-6-phosphate isomerase, class I n=1 Tax=Microbacterium sp. P02 TaxID=3366260 RepID=UPI003673159B